MFNVNGTLQIVDVTIKVIITDFINIKKSSLSSSRSPCAKGAFIEKLIIINSKYRNTS
jgi:hypothetical protein